MSIINRHYFYRCLILDVNECLPDEISDEYRLLSHTCHADANCTNTNGSFYCTCHTGYSGDGVTCVGGYSTHTILSFSTVEPLHNGHLGDKREWLLWGGRVVI